MASFDVFRTSEAEFVKLRATGAGFQRVCEWIGNDSGLPIQAGIAEISRLCIHERTFNFDDFIYVVEGEMLLTEGEETETVTPGDSVHIRAGSTVTMDVPHRLLMLWVAHSPTGDWRDGNEDYIALMER